MNVPVRALTHEEAGILGYNPRLIREALELVRRADEAQKSIPSKKLLAAPKPKEPTNG